jgi:hypothetical protein
VRFDVLNAWLLFDLEDGGSLFPQNAAQFPPDHTTLTARKHYSCNYYNFKKEQSEAPHAIFIISLSV